jgi:DNA-binding MarR family transcriptional regulator
MLLSGPNMTGIAKRLGKSGFLIRKGDARDERITLLEITPKGRQTLQNVCGEKDKKIEEYVASFSDNEKNQILEGLKRILKKSQ